MKTRKRLFASILFSVFFFGMIGLFISMYSSDKQTNENTTEIMATVSDVKIVDTGRNLNLSIYTKEYSGTLYVSNSISNMLNVNDMKTLSKDQTIVFRIQNNMVKQLEKRFFTESWGIAF